MNHPNLPYMQTLMTLKKLSDDQILEMFIDLDDFELVERISKIGFAFLENYYDRRLKKELSEEADAKQIDDAQRYRDIKSEQGNY